MGDDFKVCYEKKFKDKLNPALTAATELRHLEIDFEDYSVMSPSADVKTILGDSVWPKLEHLNLNTVSGDEQYFSDALKRQSSLRHLDLGFAVLVSGSWSSLLTSMTKLGLKSFTPVGIFEGPEETHILDMVAEDVWLEDKLELRMVSCLNFDPFEHWDHFIPALFQEPILTLLGGADGVVCDRSKRLRRQPSGLRHDVR